LRLRTFNELRQSRGREAIYSLVPFPLLRAALGWAVFFIFYAYSNLLPSVYKVIMLVCGAIELVTIASYAKSKIKK